MSNRATSARYTDIVTSTIKIVGGFSTDVDGQSDLEVAGGAKFGNNIEVTGNITGSIVGPVTGDVTGNVNTNFISAATGTLTTVSDDALFNGDITINSLNQDDTETKLVTWNSGDKSVEYVERDNMFGQALSVTSPVEHLSLSLNNDNTIISSGDDSNTLFLQTPAIATGAKSFIFNSDTTNDVNLFVQNQNGGASAHTGIFLQTDADACAGNGGNTYIIYETCGLSGWTAGRQQTTNTFRWNYLTSATDSLENDANTKMFLDTSGNLTLTGTANLGTTTQTSSATRSLVLDGSNDVQVVQRMAAQAWYAGTSIVTINTINVYENLKETGWLQNCLIGNITGGVTNGIFTYTGTPTTDIIVTASVSVVNVEGNPFAYSIAAFVDAVQVGISFTLVGGTINDCTPMTATYAICGITTGQQIRLKIANTANTDNIDVLSANLMITSM